jgi:hypothetical protein
MIRTAWRVDLAHRSGEATREADDRGRHADGHPSRAKGSMIQAARAFNWDCRLAQKT